MMKKKLILIIFICAALTANCSTSIPGGNVSGTWTLVGSPYQIQGAIMIADGSTLTIEPGVIVEFQGSYKLLVLGRLLAIGNSMDSIVFTAADTTTGWLGIRFDNTTSNNDTSKIVYCKLQYGKATGTSPNDCGGALYFNNFSKTVISNSRIVNCKANSKGGGIYCLNSNPKIVRNSILKTNSSSGGGIYCEGSSPSITYNTISRNSAGNNGTAITCMFTSNPSIAYNTISYNTNGANAGGIYCYNSNPSISNNTITYNSASASVSTISSGGIVCFGGSPTISNNSITHNTAAGYGGGGICCAGSTPTISNNTISYNTALNYTSGGGIGCASSTVNIFNNLITNNTNSHDGGGVYCGSGGTVTISNNIIANNEASNSGGAVHCNSNNAVITNNTIANNSSLYGGALYCTSSSDPIFQNNILWGNTASYGNQIYLNDDESDPNLYYCDVQGSSANFGLNTNVFYSGTYQNNINIDPLFVAPSSGSGISYNGTIADWSLQGTSPCINAGNPAGTYPVIDIAGNPRIVGAYIDIGAYEFQGIVGINKNDLNNPIIISPNPFRTATNIQFNSTINNAEMDIYNLFGQNIKTIKNISGQELILYRDNLSNGIYFICITQLNKIIFTDKIIITD